MNNLEFMNVMSDKKNSSVVVYSRNRVHDSKGNRVYRDCYNKAFNRAIQGLYENDSDFNMYDDIQVREDFFDYCENIND